MNTQQLRESPATDMALNSNQPHSAPSIGPENRESEAEGEDSRRQQNNSHLPQSHDDTPECLMVKLIMSSSWLERRAPMNTSSPAGTMKLHVAFPFWSLA